MQVAARAPEHQEAPIENSWRAGAFRHGQQVGNLGIFRAGDVARFQIVVTHPDARRQGVCGTLVYQVAQATLTAGDVESLVMLVDPEYHAARINESVGSTASEELHGLCRWPAPATV